MSPPVFPALIGLGWPVARVQSWRAAKQEAISGKRTRLNLYQYPVYNYELKFNFLRSTVALNEWQILSDFISTVNGGAGLFAFNDATDNSITAQQFGVGNGSTSVFQLFRTLYTFAEVVYLLNGSPSIYINGTLVPSYLYTISATASVCFKVPPAAGAALTWTGAYYWPSRFDEDEAPFENFYQSLWKLKALKFTTEPMDIVEAQWYNIWLVGTTPPTDFADTATEGTSNQYYYNGATFGSYAAFLPAPGYTFTRSTTKYITNSSGLLASIAIDAPPFNYAAANSPLGLLLEGASINELTYSNTFSNAAWSLAGGGGPSITQNVTGPDGVANSGWTMVAGSGGAVLAAQSPTLSGSTFNVSVFAKTGTDHWAYVSCSDAGGSAFISFNVLTGVVGTVNWKNGSPTGSLSNASIEPLANGWYRISGEWTGSTPTQARFGFADADATVVVTTGKTCEFYGADLEPQSFSSSYIATTSVAATRGADVLGRTRVSPTSFTKVIQGTTPGYTSVQAFMWSISDGTSSNVITLAYSSGVLNIQSNNSGSGQTSPNLGAVAENTPFTIAMSFGGGVFAASLNGGAAVTTSATVPSGMVDEILGNFAGSYWNSDVTIDAEWTGLAATNSNLQQLSTVVL